MIGIILSGGRGTRLEPVTNVVNKHLLPVGDRPMIYHSIRLLIDSGIKNIIVVIGRPFGSQVKKVVDLYPLPKGHKISYVTQTHAAGMADAISKCRSMAIGDSIIVVAGDNIFGSNYREEINNFKKGATSFLRKVTDPERFGVPVYQGKKLIKIVEKPKNPQTNWVVTGPHLFDSSVFKKIKMLMPSARGELEITDLNTLYIDEGRLQLIKRDDYWQDLGTFASLGRANHYLFSKKP